MKPVLLFSLVVVLSSCPGVTEAEIHSLLRELDDLDPEHRGNQVDTAKMDEFRKTLIKEEILSRLGLSSPPNVSGSTFLPTQIIENVLQQTTQEEDQVTANAHAYYGVTKQVVVMAEPDQARDEFAPPGTNILRFNTSFPRSAVSSVLLAFRRKPRVLPRKMLKENDRSAFRALQVGTTGNEKPAEVVKTDRNWVVLNVTDSFVGTRDNQLSLHIACLPCGKKKFFSDSKSYRPFLTLNVRPLSKKRVARSSKCSKRSNKCCLHRYEIKFSDLGWDNWIVAPDKIVVNYCKGSCAASGLGILRGPQHVVIRQILEQKSGKSDYQEPCCVVTDMAKMSILFRIGNGKYKKKDLPNMTALGCHCS